MATTTVECKAKQKFTLENRGSSDGPPPDPYIDGIYLSVTTLEAYQRIKVCDRCVGKAIRCTLRSELVR